MQNPTEEISNRKYGISKFSKEFLSNHTDTQVVILGAGLDPRSLEVAETFPKTIVFDVDMENRDIKKKITGRNK